ncbi:MAG: glycosyltransferase family 4 protein [Congregibacter sp.]
MASAVYGAAQLVKTLLLISYYWPPSGGPGVYRWLKMAKYLPEHGWRVVVVTPENPERPAYDESLLSDVRADQEVLRLPILEPYGIYRWFSGVGRKPMYSGFISDDQWPSWKQRLAAWLRGNLLIPDPRLLWIRPASKFIIKNLKSINPDVIISTGPPHSMHLIGRRVHEKTGIPWVADFRDPWTEIYYFKRLGLSGFAQRKHRRLEESVVTGASRVVTVSHTWSADFTRVHGRSVDVIPNGYDAADFPEQSSLSPTPHTIAHFGALQLERNPHALWQAMERLKSDCLLGAEHLRLESYGPVDGTVLRAAAKHGVQDQLSLHPYTGHAEVVTAMRSSALLLVVNQSDSAGVIPGKLYEYLAAGRPILLIGNADGDAASLIRRFDAGWVADFDDATAVYEVLRKLLERGGLLERSGTDVSSFYRSKLAQDYAGLLNAIT